MAEDQDVDPAAEALAAGARLWWERQTEEALRDLRLYPVQVEDMGRTTSDPGGW